MKLKNYKPFKDFIFRIPIFPVQFWKMDMSDSDIFKESVFLASPDLYDALNSKNNKEKQISRTKFSLAKYQIRMSSRCTPFGLFAACGVGEISTSDSILLSGIGDFQSHTRLDMFYICNLIDYLVSIPEIRNQLRFKVNSSLYEVHNSYRYIEYKHVNKRRKYFLSEVERDEYIDSVIKAGDKPKTIFEMTSRLLEFDLEKEDIENFIQNLIDNQIIVSELEPKVTGSDLLQQLISKLQSLNIAPNILSVLTRVAATLNSIDKHPLGRSIELYKEIFDEISNIPVEYERKYLFQSDLFVRPKRATLSSDAVEEILGGLEVLRRLNTMNENPQLKKFKEQFYRRYEEEEIPLVEVMDTDIGIGFSNLYPGNTDIHPLIDGVAIPVHQQNVPSSTFTPIEQFIYEKYVQCKINGSFEIILQDEEVMKLPETKQELPPTISTIVEVLKDKHGERQLILKPFGGSSAANLLARFSHLDEKIGEHIKTIIEEENEHHSKSDVLAEIVHLPEARVGNILYRPVFRRFEIPYLAHPSVSEENTIPITDLMISVKGGREIILRSKKLNARVIPRLSSAHNYSSNSLPIYNFLCNLQTEDYRSKLFFSWGNIAGSRPFLPRVRYKNCILTPATWSFSTVESENLSKDFKESNSMGLSRFRSENRIPSKVLLVNGDNKLLIDFESDFSSNLFINEVAGKTFSIEECLFDENHDFATSKDGVYTNEIIVNFHKEL